MTNFVSLEEAAKKLGVSVDQLVEMRSRGEIFGYRDGASWKFKPEEIQRVASEMFGDVLDEDPAGSSILNLDSEKPKSSSGMSSSALGTGSSGADSELSLQVDPQSSDLRLVANSDLSLDQSSEGSGISDVDESGLRLASSDDDDDELELASEDSDELIPDLASPSKGKKSGEAQPKAGAADAGGSDSSIQISLDSDLEIVSDSDAAISLDSDAKSSSVKLGGGSDLELGEQSDLIRGDSDPGIGGGSSGVSSDLDLDKDLELEDDLVLGSGSDLALGADSGINLMSPADSGISLEDEPLDLAASGISGLEIAGEGSQAGGSGVDFQKDEDFQLSPSGSLDVDEDSGSQVIELEESSEIAAEPVAGGLDDLGDVGGAVDTAFPEEDVFGQMTPTVAGAAVAASPEVPYSTLQVLALLLILLVLTFNGILVTDIVRNLWAWSGNENALTSGFTQMLVGK